MWFRQPDSWFIYDRQAAHALGVGEGSIRGMRTFFGVLHACGVKHLDGELHALVTAAGLDLRSERIIDKVLWLLGATLDETLPESRISQCRSWASDKPELHELALSVQRVFPSDYFDILARSPA